MSSTSFLSRHRVDDVPVLLRLPYWLYAYGMALALFACSILIHYTSKIHFYGQGHLDERSNYIFCFWHTFIPLYFCIFLRHSHHVWIQHPSWLMKHVHILLRLAGVRRIVLGSTGHSGREAADEIVEYLKQGYSTVMLPDGPHGPPYVLHKGVLHISQQSNVPIVPMRFSVSRYLESKGWDKKRIPLPFSIIEVLFCTPIHITPERLSEASAQLEKALGVPD